jgi:acyl carrier protein
VREDATVGIETRAPVADRAPTAATPPGSAVLRLVEAIVSEKTGYPAEVLGHDMDLEAELGIDSIKQVEILSALRDRMPGLPEIEPSALARYRTIGAIAAMIAGEGGPADVPPTPPGASAPVPAAPKPAQNPLRPPRTIIATSVVA